MRILIAAGIFPPDIGGPATYAEEIAEQFNKQGVKADIICYSTEKRKDNYNFKVFRISRKHPLLIRYFFYFLKVLRLGKNYDIIYAQGPVSSGFSASKAAKLLNKKLVVKITGDYAWEQARNLGIYNGSIEDFQRMKFSDKIGKLQRIEREVCQLAYLVIVPSQYLRRIVAVWGIEDKKIKVIYNTVKKSSISFSKNRDNNLILSIGRLVPWKGFDTLISLMPDLLKINPDFRLAILGSGPEENKLRDLVNKLNLQEKVSISQQSHKQVLNQLSRAGIFVLNTDYEGLSHTTLEAMSLDVPVVISKVGGNPELIKHGYNGLLFEHNNKEQITNAISKIYQDSELSEKFVKNSKQTLKKFDFNKMIQNTLMALKNL